MINNKRHFSEKQGVSFEHICSSEEIMKCIETSRENKGASRPPPQEGANKRVYRKTGSIPGSEFYPGTQQKKQELPNFERKNKSGKNSKNDKERRKSLSSISSISSDDLDDFIPTNNNASHFKKVYVQIFFYYNLIIIYECSIF